ncbi:nucleotide sugar dehydrogenase [Sphingobium fluviale]|uniref:Nucleotide sugar dehydrogenase n=1 Tax=Sphingobium fluviale TaxID=2506423 RepID=A0A4Q1KF55_9SPHN|nr:nucleotide sugar dehydrogenase [Sphingobium fluviale]RXR26569.1 nucleotide sugar dehydrogenase [Sphingobium fluviale]
MPSAHYEQTLTRLEDGTATIGIIGLGYVGLPLALAGVKAGYTVIGFDISQGRVDAINAGEQVISYMDPTEMREALAAGKFEATADFVRLGEPDALAICVPTPLTRNRDPDLSYVVNTAEMIAKTLRPGQLVVLESTTWPGTTREVVQPVLEGAGGILGETFFLGFSPEREDPGNQSFNTKTIPKLVGADDPQSRKLAETFYGKTVAKVVPVNSAAVAEAAKLTENIFRAVNIALVNELKLVYAEMGIDVWEVIAAAATKPFGYQAFYPGPGLGGHCIPIDPFYLTWKAREFGIESRFIELAGQINTAMPRYVVGELARALNAQSGKGLKGAKVLILGLAYKSDVDDLRESPSLTLIDLIEAQGAHVEFHDPHIPVVPMTREHAELAGRESAPLDPASLAGYDAVLISTDHAAVDYALVADHAKLIVDTRNALAKRGINAAQAVKA